jgi:ferredoxin-NADP reductase
MSLKELIKEIDGYDEIQSEIGISQKYGTDYSAQRGRTQQIVNLLHPKTLKLRVSEIIKETSATKTLRLVSTDGYLPPFHAGQYINLSVDIKGIRTNRPYSISSPPNQIGYYDITVRRVENGFVSDFLLGEVKVGDEFESTSPCGNFYYNPLFHGNDLVFLAGGSGITPFMSMIREVIDRGLSRRIHLIYGSQDPNDVIFHNELLERKELHDNFIYDLVISNPSPGYKGLAGFLSSDLIKKLVDDISLKTFYLCGPEVMYGFCWSALEQLGIPRRKVRTEVKGPPKVVTSQPGWPKKIHADSSFMIKVKGRMIEAKAGEPLIVSLERHGAVIPSACRSGECSLCRTKLISGRVFHPQEVKLRKSDRQFGYIHPCMAYPIEDLELVL